MPRDLQGMSCFLLGVYRKEYKNSTPSLFWVLYLVELSWLVDGNPDNVEPSFGDGPELAVVDEGVVVAFESIEGSRLIIDTKVQEVSGSCYGYSRHIHMPPSHQVQKM